MDNIYDRLDSLIIEDESKKQLLISKIPPIDYTKIFFNWLGPSLKSQFTSILPTMEIAPFFKALQYELGLNNKEKNLRKAYFLYLDNATHTTDYLSMYRIFEIHFNESQKFKIKKDKILEMFFLFKSCAYLPVFTLETEIFREFNPKNALFAFFEIEDPDYEKFNSFLSVIENNIGYTHLLKDLSLIKATVFLLTNQIYEYKQFKEMTEEDDNMEMKLKIAVSVYKSDKERSFNLLEKCIEEKYYRAYLEYGRFIQIELGMIDKAIEIYKQGFEGGNFSCYSYYYFIYLRTIDFSTSENAIKGLIELLPYLINAILFKNYSLISELFDIIKYIHKHNGIIPQEYETYLQEIITFLLQNKNINEYDYLYNLGLLYSYSYTNKVEKNLNEALLYFNKITEQKELPLPILRSIQVRIFNIKRKLYKQGLIDKEELMNTAKHFYDLIKQTLSPGSESQHNPSVHYYAGMLTEFINEEKSNDDKYLKEAFDNYYKSANQLGNKRFVFGCFVRKEKSKRKIQGKFKKICENKIKQEEEKQKEYSNMLSIKLSECSICFVNKLSVYFVPCSHKSCSSCYEKIKGTKCPFCRGIISSIINF